MIKMSNLHLPPPHPPPPRTSQFFVKPAVQGTLNVLNAAAGVVGVKRVVMTSSTAAIFRNVVTADHVYSEADWNDVEELRTRSMWYSIGKTLQESAAWDWMKEEARPFDLVCINPTVVAGKMRQPGVNASNESVLEYCNGTKDRIPNVCIPWVSSMQSPC